MKVKETYSTFQQLKTITKYGISLFALLGVAHCGLLFFGYDIFAIHIIACIFALFMGLALSRVFNLCWVHKACVIYICAVLICIVFRRHGAFQYLEIDIHKARGIMYSIGVILMGFVVWKATRKNS